MISIDTNTMIWGVKGVATPNRQHMIERAKYFLKKCREDRVRIIVPAQVLAEYLVSFDDDERVRNVAVIERYFFIAPLDAKAAAIAAELQHNRELVKNIREEFGVTRQCISADGNVIATSVAAGASTLYCHDLHMVKLAQGKILVKGLPEIPAPEKHLFEDDE